MKRSILLIILLSVILFGQTNSAIAADAAPLSPVVTSLDPVYTVDNINEYVAALQDPCSGALFELQLANCTFFDAEAGADWYRKVMSCDIQIDGVTVGRVISEYLRLATTEDSDEKIWVQIRDQMVFDGALTIWGNSYNDTYNHWGAEGMSVNILDSGFNSIENKIKYKYTFFNEVYKLCLWLVE